MACGDAGCQNCDAGDPSENAYWVETETPGCPSCGNHTLYRVVHLDIKGDEFCHSVMYEDKEIAEELAENLNSAYDLGFSKGYEEGAQAVADTVIMDAPGMLEILREARGWFQIGGAADKLRRKIDAAITKAEGRT